MKLAALGLALALVAAPQATDVKGKWEGKLVTTSDDGSKRENNALLILDQKDATITGSVGGDENDQHPITSGTIDGNKVVIDAKTASGREYHLELTVENDEMKGSVASGERRATLELKRRKD